MNICRTVVVVVRFTIKHKKKKSNSFLSPAFIRWWCKWKSLLLFLPFCSLLFLLAKQTPSFCCRVEEDKYKFIVKSNLVLPAHEFNSHTPTYIRLTRDDGIYLKSMEGRKKGESKNQNQHVIYENRLETKTYKRSYDYCLCKLTFIHTFPHPTRI